MSCNILVMWVTIRPLQMLLPRSWKWQTTLSWYSPSATHQIYLGARPRNPRFLASLTLPKRRGSCNPSGISSSICLLYCNQLRLQILRNEYFWSLPQHYDPVRTTYPRRLRCTFICRAFKSHSEWSNERVSALTTMILPTAAGIYLGLNSFSHVIYVSQTSTYQNIAKLLTHLRVYIYIYIYI